LGRCLHQWRESFLFPPKTKINRPENIAGSCYHFSMRINVNAKVIWAQCTSHRCILDKLPTTQLKRALKVACIILISFVGMGASKPMLELGCNHYWPPYSYVDDQNRPAGIFFDILKEALNQRMGIPVKAISLPWGRVQTYVRERKVDGMITVTTQERLKYLVASENVFSISLNIYVNKSSPNYSKLADITDISGLAPFEVCEINGNQSAIERYQRFQIEKVKLITKYTQCFQMLERQRVDFVVVPPALGNKLITDLGMADSIAEILLRIPANHNLLIHKQSPYVDALPEFNRVIQKMREEGFIEKIATKHGAKFVD
jgi:polar amino acid transport system substrate-binding protein